MELDARVADLEQANSQNDEKVVDLEDRAEQIQLATRQLREVWKRVEVDLEAAAAKLDQAARTWGRASDAYRQAQQDYEAAERNWKIVATTLIVASLSNAGSRSLCDGQMNTAKVRRLWKGEGYDLTGIDADHIWPKSLGGADHAWNYQRMEASLNRSLGNSLSWKLLHEPLALLRGGAVSALVALSCR